jgi:hypothetical protein
MVKRPEERPRQRSTQGALLQNYHHCQLPFNKIAIYSSKDTIAQGIVPEEKTH